MSKIATRPQELVEWVRSDERREQIRRALPEGVSLDTFERATASALLTKPELLKAERGSLYIAIIDAALAGLRPDGKQGAIVVYGDKATFIPMIGGVRDVLAEYGWMLTTNVIYDADRFEVDNARGRVLHSQARPGVDRGQVEGAYAQAVHRDGRAMAEVMSVAEINHVRDKSSKSKNVWADWWTRMAEKTVGHRLAKKLPLDPKDRERVDRLVAEELEPGEAADVLYGSQESTPGTSPAGADTGAGETTAAGLPASAFTDSDAPTPEQLETLIAARRAEQTVVGGPSLDDEPGLADEPTGELTDADLLTLAVAAESYVPPNGKFGAGGEHGPKTLAEIADLGDVGRRWFRWALAAPSVAAIPEYAAALASYTRVFAPGLHAEALTKKDLAE
jgi:phage RecT family recombinase